MTPRIGLDGQFFDSDPNAAHPVWPATITVVHNGSPVLVDCVRLGAAVADTDVPFVDLGGPAPGTGVWFQAMDYSAP